MLGFVADKRFDDIIIERFRQDDMGGEVMTSLPTYHRPDRCRFRAGIRRYVPCSCADCDAGGGLHRRSVGE